MKEWSLHLTLSLVCVRWSDLLSASKLDQNSKRSILRKFGLTGDTQYRRIDAASDVLAVEPRLESTIVELRQRWIQELSVLPRRHGIDSSVRLRSSTRVQLAADMIAYVIKGQREGTIELQVPGLRLALPVAAHATLLTLLTRNAVRVGRFPITASPKSKIILASKLVSCGILEIVEP